MEKIQKRRKKKDCQAWEVQVVGLSCPNQTIRRSACRTGEPRFQAVSIAALDMTTSTHRATNLYSALGSRKISRNNKDEEVDDPTPKDEGTGPATSMDAAIAIQSSWAHADTWEGDGEDLGELPEGWVQEEVRDWLAFEIAKAYGSVPKDANQAPLGRKNACDEGR